jgi:hypothetical protein
MRQTPLTGTAANIGFSLEETGTFPPGPNEVGGTATTGWSFTGALNGPEVAGTLTLSRRINSNGSAVPGVGTASAAATLR